MKRLRITFTTSKHGSLNVPKVCLNAISYSLVTIRQFHMAVRNKWEKWTEGGDVAVAEKIVSWQEKELWARGEWRWRKPCDRDAFCPEPHTYWCSAPSTMHNVDYSNHRAILDRPVMVLHIALWLKLHFCFISALTNHCKSRSNKLSHLRATPQIVLILCGSLTKQSHQGLNLLYFWAQIPSSSLWEAILHQIGCFFTPCVNGPWPPPLGFTQSFLFGAANNY